MNKKLFGRDLDYRKVYVLLFIVIFFITRFLFVGYEEINPDTVNWYYRSEQFIVGLKSLQLEKTYQHYHPGTTLMWIMGISTEIIKKIDAVGEVINNENFLVFHIVTKVVFGLVQLVLSLAILYLLSKILGFVKALLVVSIFSFEPFFIGNSRFLHLDVLLSLFIITTLALSFYNYYVREKPSSYISIIIGILALLTFLTKSIGISVLPMIVLTIMLGNPKYRLQSIIIVLSSLILMAPIFLPALIKDYSGTIALIFKEALRIGNKNGHEQIFLGEETINAGFWFYFVSLLIKVSPLLMVSTVTGVIVFTSNIKKNITKIDKFYLLSALYYVGYFVVMSLLSKKLDRYMIPMFPFFSLFAVYAFSKFYDTKSNFSKVMSVVFTLCLFLNVYSLINLFPYYFVYASQLSGGPVLANSLIAQKPFGQGVVWLKDYLLDKYGEPKNVGIYDRKPLSMIYPNSKLFDVREYDPTKYDILVLAVNEEIPEKVENGDAAFNLMNILYINNLPYWRIYEKVK